MLACHTHWTHEELLNMDHAERRRWLGAIHFLQAEAA